MKFLLLFAGVLFMTDVYCQDLINVKETSSCSEARANLNVIKKNIDGNKQLIIKLASHMSQMEQTGSPAGIVAVIAKNETELDKDILEFTTRINSQGKSNGDQGWMEREKKQLDRDYYVAMRDLYQEIRTRKLVYGAVDTSEIKAARLKRLLGLYPEKKINYEKLVVMYQKNEADAEHKLAELKCEAQAKITIADEAAREDAAIAKLLGGWTDKPTPWGTPGGPCQIIKDEGKLKLINEDKDKSGASVTVDSEGNVTIHAKDWPVTGKVSKDFKSIKWSNNSMWIR